MSAAMRELAEQIMLEEYYPEVYDTAEHLTLAIARALADVAEAGEHFRYCDLAGTEIEFRCPGCMKAAALTSQEVPRG